MRENILILFFIFLTSNLLCQSELENFFETSDENAYNNSQIEAVEYFRDNPINLSTATPDELIRLKVISLSQALIIYRFVNSHPEFQYSMITDSLNFSPEIENILENCTYLKKKFSKRNNFINIRSRYKHNFYETDGLKENKFLGNGLDLNNRIYSEFNNINTGILADKNPGEEKFYDMTSAYIQYTKKDFGVILGDYNLDFANGSLFSSSFGKRKGANSTTDIIFMGNGSSANRSSIENSIFRGVSANGNIFSTIGKFNITGFYSNINRSATVNENNTVTSIYQSGLYRTENEISKKNKVNEQIAGLNLQLDKEFLKFGITSYYLEYDKTVNSTAQSIYSGKSGLFSSSYIYYFKNDFLYTAEVGIDPNQNYLINSAFEYSYARHKIAMNYRYIKPDYRSGYGNMLCESSYLANETGLYSGYSYFRNNFNINLYADLYETFQCTYFIPAPMKGLDLYSELLYKISSKEILLIRLKSENKSDSYKNEILNAKEVSQMTKYYLRFDYTNSLSKQFTIRYRLETTYNQSDFDNEKGYLTFFELKFNKKIFNINTRITYFDTDSYDSSIWLFEYAVPGYLSTMAMYGQGVRLTISSKINIGKNISLNIRYAALMKNNTDHLGSGYDEIQSNIKNDLILQLNAEF